MKPDEAIENIEYARRWMGSESDFSEEALDMAILALKKLEQDKWIPCKERLPEEYGVYRITWKTSRSEKRFIAYAEYEPENEYDAVNREFVGKWLLEDNIRYYPNVEVIAWKPIEEPYTEEES